LSAGGCRKRKKHDKDAKEDFIAQKKEKYL
jgi:hypothetical protein